MLSMAPVRSAGGAAKYFAADNYYTLEESAEESLWYGEGAEMLGLAPGEEAEPEPDAEAAPAEAAAEQELEAAEVEVGSEVEAGDEPSETDEQAGGDEPSANGGSDAPGEAQEHSGELLDTDASEGAAEPAETTAGSEIEEAGSDSVPPAVEAGPEPDAAQPGDEGPPFDPDRAGGSPDAATASASTATAPEEIPFDPERANGLPEGIAAPASADAGRPTNLPLSNPSGKVDAGTFQDILNGKLPDGTQVGIVGKRALGIDLTFSMPKSASLIALVGGDKRIVDANMAAVKTAMRWAEANLAEGRQKIDGRDVPVRTGNLVYALFQHDTSRSLDPQGHVHAVIANMTRMPGGEWRALHNGEIWRNNTVIGSIYRAALRDALEKLGYTTELTGKHGTFEIAGVAKDIRDAFSQRREAILAKGEALGIATPQGLRKVTENSRDAKVAVGDHGTLRDGWQVRAEALGWDPRPLIDAAHERAEHQPGLFERGLNTIETSLREARTYILETLHKPSDPLVDAGLARLMLTGPEARTQLATASAIRILSQREAAFEVHQLTKTALDLGLKGVTPALIAARVTELVRRQEIVPGETLRPDNVVTMLTTRDALQTESAIIRQIGAGKGAVAPLVNPERALAVLNGAAGERSLNDGQLAAASSIIASSDRIVAVQGIAGAGKSTMLAAVANVLAFEKKSALGLAFQNKMVADLAAGTGLEAMTVARFLMHHEPLLSDNGGKLAERSRSELAGGYLILDEASMISNDQMLALVRTANFGGVEKLVLVGDRQQLLSIDAGKSFAVIQAGGVTLARMDENLRQRTPELRAVAALTNQGKAGAAVRLLGARVTETDDRVGEAAQQWLHLNPAERDATMLLTSGRETRAGLNRAIQDGLKAEGTLKGEGLQLTVADRVDRTREDLRYAHSYTPGLHVEVWSRLQSVGLERGDYRVTRVFGNGKVELERGGKRIKFDPQKLASGAKQDKLNLVATKDIRIHEGDKIRWTTNDKDRDLLNSALARVVSIDDRGVVFERADQSVVRMEMGDPMLKRLDLAYALNMHMAQGVTTDKGMVVMGSEERFLSNQRLFNVAVTRVRDAVSVITDDKDKLARQLDRTSGDKYSALEEAGRLDVDKQRSVARDIGKPFDPGPVSDLSLANDKPPPARAADTPRAARDQPVQPAPTPEKSKGLEL
jgi:conjugative relaxase-like TrwC/TraI family protein